MLHSTRTAEPITAEQLVQAGLLDIGAGCRLHPAAVFIPQDLRGTLRPIVLGEQVTVGAYAVLHGGLCVGAQTHVGHHVILGEPEYGYAVREVYPGAGGTTNVGAGVVIRAGAIIYAGTTIGDDTTIGHHALLRTGVRVGTGTQLAANLTVERGTRIGSGVRCSPGSHLTADTVVSDRAFIGAGVRTINDKELIWRDPEHEVPLRPHRPRATHWRGRGGCSSCATTSPTVGTAPRPARRARCGRPSPNSWPAPATSTCATAPGPGTAQWCSPTPRPTPPGGGVAGCTPVS